MVGIGFHKSRSVSSTRDYNRNNNNDSSEIAQQAAKLIFQKPSLATNQQAQFQQQKGNSAVQSAVVQPSGSQISIHSYATNKIININSKNNKVTTTAVVGTSGGTNGGAGGGPPAHVPTTVLSPANVPANDPLAVAAATATVPVTGTVAGKNVVPGTPVAGTPGAGHALTHTPGATPATTPAATPTPTPTSAVSSSRNGYFTNNARIGGGTNNNNNNNSNNNGVGGTQAGVKKRQSVIGQSQQQQQPPLQHQNSAAAVKPSSAALAAASVVARNNPQAMVAENQLVAESVRSRHNSLRQAQHQQAQQAAAASAERPAKIVPVPDEIRKISPSEQRPKQKSVTSMESRATGSFSDALSYVKNGNGNSSASLIKRTNTNNKTASNSSNINLPVIMTDLHQEDEDDDEDDDDEDIGQSAIGNDQDRFLKKKFQDSLAAPNKGGGSDIDSRDPSPSAKPHPYISFLENANDDSKNSFLTTPFTKSAPAPASPRFEIGNLNFTNNNDSSENFDNPANGYTSAVMSRTYTNLSNISNISDFNNSNSNSNNNNNNNNRDKYRDKDVKEDYFFKAPINFKSDDSKNLATSEPEADAITSSPRKLKRKPPPLKEVSQDELPQDEKFAQDQVLDAEAASQGNNVMSNYSNNSNNNSTQYLRPPPTFNENEMDNKSSDSIVSDSSKISCQLASNSSFLNSSQGSLVVDEGDKEQIAKASPSRKKPPPDVDEEIQQRDENSQELNEEFPGNGDGHEIAYECNGYHNDNINSNVEFIDGEVINGGDQENSEADVLPRYPTYTPTDNGYHIHPHIPMNKQTKKIFKRSAKSLLGNIKHNPSNPNFSSSSSFQQLQISNQSPNGKSPPAQYYKSSNQSNSNLNPATISTTSILIPQHTTKFKTTMRKDKNSKKFNEDKPWKHHNDANIITEQERKRYEGVWVSNKLLFVDLNPGTKASIGTQHESMTAATIAASAKEPSSGLLMHGLIVREIWKRSRLPFETLEKIYDLVDIKTKNGFLTREEFIVGMWLVDQCLYGRKLPKFVADEVWESVYSTGIISSNINFGKKNKSRKGL